MTRETCERLAEHFENLGDKKKAEEYRARMSAGSRASKKVPAKSK